MDISVIIPIYNVEQYIERCLRSIFTQTKTNRVEFIVVNDCTPDRSMEIVQQIIAEYANINVRIVNNEKNLGIGATRQIGIDLAIGEYTIQIDSDDWCEPTMLEELYDVAKQENADLVICDSIDVLEDKQVYGKRELPNDKVACLKKLLMKPFYQTMWNKFVKRELYAKKHGVFFMKEINHTEDLLASCKLFYYAKKVFYHPKAYLYYNVQNSSSITRSVMNASKCGSIIGAINETESFLKKTEYYLQVKQELIEKKAKAKLNLILITKGVLQKQCAELWPETNKEIFNSNYHFHHKLIMWFAVNGMIPISNLILGLIKLVKNR